MAKRMCDQVMLHFPGAKKLVEKATLWDKGQVVGSRGRVFGGSGEGTFLPADCPHMHRLHPVSP
jgi:hypothetical protein